MAEVVVRNLAAWVKTLNNAPRDVKRAGQAKLRTVAEPVRSGSERLAVARIPKVTQPWSRMRVGVTQKSVYVAPRKRGVKARAFAARRRPNFGTLMMDRAMQPALEQNRARIERDFEDMLDRLVVEWDREGP